MQLHTTAAQAPKIELVDELFSSMKQLLSPADRELMAGDQVRSLIAYVEEWAQTYQRGMNAGAAISQEEIGMLQKTRNELAQILSERLTLEDEGGQPATKQQAERMEHVASAIRRIDQVLPHTENDNAASSASMLKHA